MTRTTTLRCAVILALLVAGCAKQPSTTTGMTSPAPGGAAGSAMDPARQGTGGGAGAAQGGAAGAMGRADARPPVKDFREVPGLADVHFDYDKADIRPVDVKVLDVNAGWLKEHPDHLVLIEGHCDERGTSEYNTALGDRRAKATMNYLVSRGVPSSRISVISYGEQRPACRQSDAGCWAKNRRAHFLVKPR